MTQRYIGLIAVIIVITIYFIVDEYISKGFLQKYTAVYIVALLMGLYKLGIYASKFPKE